MAEGVGRVGRVGCVGGVRSPHGMAEHIEHTGGH